MLILFWVVVTSTFIGCSAKEVKFSPERGFCDSPFQLVLSYSGGPVIRFTTGDGSIQPDASVGTVYTGPITISKTTVVIAYGLDPTTSIQSNWSTHTFIFLNDIISSSVMRTAVTQNPVWRPLMRSALLHVPTLSITMKSPPIDIAFEKPINVEWISNDGSNVSYSYLGGAQVYGGASRSFLKNSIRLYFRSKYGPKNFKGDIFKGFDSPYSSVKSFDTIALRGGSQDSVFGQFHGSYIKNIWSDWIMQDLGHLVPHARFVHVYVNTVYRGVHHMREREVDRFLEDYLGSNSSDYEALNTGTQFRSPGWTTVKTQPTNWPFVKNWLSQVHFMDFMIIVHYTGNYDQGAQKNWQAAGCAKPSPWNGPWYGFKFYHNDQDMTMDYGNVIGLDTSQSSVPDNLFMSLMGARHPDFLQLFQDRVHYLVQRVDGKGKLQPAYVTDLLQRIITHMNLTIIPESARWGTYWSGQPNPQNFTIETWYYHMSRIIKDWTPVRPRILLGQYARLGWLSTYAAPTFSLDDESLVASGTPLVITNVNASLSTSSIVYTMDGSDPRLDGGAVSTTAIIVPQGTPTISITLTKTVIVKARLHVGNSWSPLQVMTFKVTEPCPLCNNIIISEIHYHPNTTRTPNGRIEFIEIQNIGTTTQDLTRAYFDGIDYVFPSVRLAPGQFYVIASAWEEFNTFYGRTPSATFFGSLSTSGEKITLYDSLGNKVIAVDYDNNLPWPEIADHMSFSIVPRNASELLSNPSNAKQWRASTNPNGSPFAADRVMPSSRTVPLIITEIATAEDATLPEWIEIFNPTANPVTIYNWAITNDFSKDKFRVPNIQIQPNQYLVFNSTQLGFRFDNEGGTSVVFGSICCDLAEPVPVISGEFHQQDFDENLPGKTLGRYVSSTGRVFFPMMSSKTPGNANTQPLLGPIIISSVAFQASGIFAGGEYIKLTSISTSPVNLKNWELKVGKKSVNGPAFVFPSVILNPKEFVYVIKTTEASFNSMYKLSSAKLVSLSNTSWNLNDHIVLKQFYDDGNGTNYTVPLEDVEVAEVFAMKPKKRQSLDLVGISRNEQSLGFSGDPSFWLTLSPPVPLPPSLPPTPTPTPTPQVTPTPGVPSPTPVSPVPVAPPSTVPVPVSNPVPIPVSNPVPVPVNAPIPPPNSNSTQTTSSGLAGWAVALIVLSILFVLALVIGFAIYYHLTTSSANFETV